MKNKIIWVLVGTIVILALGAFLWITYFDSPKKSSLSISDSNPDKQLAPGLHEVVSQVEKANTPQAPANWKVYKPQNLKLTLKYPSNLLFQDTQSGLNIYYDTEENRAYVKNPNEHESNRPGMFIVGVSPVQDPDAYIKETYSKLESQWEHSTTTLFGQKATVFTGQGMDRWDLILFVNNKTVYEVT
ncbi:MAG: hypothetical protein AAB966_05670, partial [Patescibacteria group bacterium]